MAKEIKTGEFDGATAGGVKLVDFWAPWCGPCKMLGAIIDKIEPEIEALGAEVCKVNVDEEPELAVRFEVMSIPALLFFKNGELAHRLDGLQRPDDVLSAVKSLV